jgi:hypothetical protein
MFYNYDPALHTYPTITQLHNKDESVVAHNWMKAEEIRHFLG